MTVLMKDIQYLNKFRYLTKACFDDPGKEVFENIEGKVKMHLQTGTQPMFSTTLKK